MKTYISKLVSCCHHQLWRIRQVRRLVGQDVAQQLVSAYTLSRLDYCDSLLSRLPRSTIRPLQHVMNAAAQVIMNLSLRDHVQPAPKQLHWLPFEQRITYKLCLFMHHIHTGQAPQYLSYRVSTVSALRGRYRLRSTGSADYVLPRTRTRFGERGFSYCGPATWNTLPSDLHGITDTSTSRKRLKSVLYDRAYHWLLLALLDVSYSGALQISRWLINWLTVNAIGLVRPNECKHYREWIDCSSVLWNRCSISCRWKLGLFLLY